MKLPASKGFATQEVLTPEQRQQKLMKKIDDVAQVYEKHFLREMTKAMRSTVHESGFITVNQGEKIFRQQLDDEYAEKWGDQGGIGLSQMIKDQILDRFGVQMGLKKEIAVPKGPIKLNQKDQLNVLNTSSDQATQKPRASFKIEKDSAEPSPLVSPWDGTISHVQRLNELESVIVIEHDNGIKSQLAFKGAVSKDLTGKDVKSGEVIGQVGPGKQSLYWNLSQHPNKTASPVESTDSVSE